MLVQRTLEYCAGETARIRVIGIYGLDHRAQPGDEPLIDDEIALFVLRYRLPWSDTILNIR